MGTPKTKTTTRRSPSKASAPIPRGPVGGSTCGHDGCERTCRVRYAGPTSPIHNEHIIHAARGASQVWTAAIVAGLAVVLTGAIAFSAVQAETSATDPTTLMLLSLRRIEMRLDRMEPKINRIAAALTQQNASGTTMNEDNKPGQGLSNIQSPTGTAATATAACATKCANTKELADRKACLTECAKGTGSGTTTTEGGAGMLPPIGGQQ